MTRKLRQGDPLPAPGCMLSDLDFGVAVKMTAIGGGKLWFLIVGKSAGSFRLLRMRISPWHPDWNSGLTDQYEYCHPYAVVTELTWPLRELSSDGVSPQTLPYCELALEVQGDDE